MSNAKTVEDLGIKKYASSAEKCEDATKYPKELRNSRDLRLKDAGKPMANRDAIAKMLQGHVRKLEETFKENLEECEDSGYKYCVVSKQIKTLRAGRRSEEERFEKYHEEVCTKPKQESPKETVESSAKKCSYGIRVQNMRSLVQVHNEFLHFVTTLSEKRSVFFEGYAGQVANSQKEMGHLKEENITLNDQEELQTDLLIPRTENDLLNKYKKTNEEVQLVEMSSVSGLQNVERSFKENETFSEESVTLMNQSVSNEITGGSAAIINEEGKFVGSASVDPETESLIDTLKTETEMTDEEYMKSELTEQKNYLEEGVIENKKVNNTQSSAVGVERKISENLHNSCSFSVKKDEKTDSQETEIVFCDNTPPCEENVEHSLSKINENDTETKNTNAKALQQGSFSTLQDSNEVSLRLNDIRSRVTEVLNNQISTHKEIEFLKNETSALRDELIENISKLKRVSLPNFQEYATIKNNLTHLTDNIQRGLAELNDKIEALFEKLGRKRSSQSETGINGNCGLQAESSEERTTANGVSHQNEVAPNLPNTCNKLQEQRESLKKERKQEDGKAKNINDLIMFCKKMSIELLTFSEIPPDEHSNISNLGDVDISSYVDQVESETIRLKSTVSSVIYLLNTRITELKDANDRKQHKCSFFPTFVGGLEEIENVSNASNTCRTKKLPSNSSSTSCARKYRSPQRSSCDCPTLLDHPNNDEMTSYEISCRDIEPEHTNNFEDSFASFQCMCRSGLCRSNAQDIIEETNTNSELCSELDFSLSITDPCNSSNICSVPDLENYVNYLYEQLNVISYIENQIDDFRYYIKDP